MIRHIAYGTPVFDPLAEFLVLIDPVFHTGRTEIGDLIYFSHQGQLCLIVLLAYLLALFRYLFLLIIYRYHRIPETQVYFVALFLGHRANVFPLILVAA